MSKTSTSGTSPTAPTTPSAASSGKGPANTPRRRKTTDSVSSRRSWLQSMDAARVRCRGSTVRAVPTPPPFKGPGRMAHHVGVCATRTRARRRSAKGQCARGSGMRQCPCARACRRRPRSERPLVAGQNARPVLHFARGPKGHLGASPSQAAVRARPPEPGETDLPKTQFARPCIPASRRSRRPKSFPGRSRWRGRLWPPWGAPRVPF